LNTAHEARIDDFRVVPVHQVQFPQGLLGENRRDVSFTEERDVTGRGHTQSVTQTEGASMSPCGTWSGMREVLPQSSGVLTVLGRDHQTTIAFIPDCADKCRRNGAVTLSAAENQEPVSLGVTDSHVPNAV
jgi:hypothetical protein